MVQLHNVLFRCTTEIIELNSAAFLEAKEPLKPTSAANETKLENPYLGRLDVGLVNLRARLPLQRVLCSDQATNRNRFRQISQKTHKGRRTNQTGLSPKNRNKANRGFQRRDQEDSDTNNTRNSLNQEPKSEKTSTRDRYTTDDKMTTHTPEGGG